MNFAVGWWVGIVGSKPSETRTTVDILAQGCSVHSARFQFFPPARTLVLRVAPFSKKCSVICNRIFFFTCIGSVQGLLGGGRCYHSPRFATRTFYQHIPYKKKNIQVRFACPAKETCGSSPPPRLKTYLDAGVGGGSGERQGDCCFLGGPKILAGGYGAVLVGVSIV